MRSVSCSGTDHQDVFSNIAVSMHDELVVICPMGRLDRASTATLVSLVGATTSCKAVVLIDLDGTGSSPFPSCPSAGDDLMIATSEAPAGLLIVGDGYVRLKSGSIYWTFDLQRRRLFRSDTPIDHRFVEPHDWVTFRKLWTTATTTTVLSEHGTFLSTPTGWTAHQDTTTDLPFYETPRRDDHRTRRRSAA